MAITYCKQVHFLKLRGRFQLAAIGLIELMWDNVINEAQCPLCILFSDTYISLKTKWENNSPKAKFLFDLISEIQIGFSQENGKFTSSVCSIVSLILMLKFRLHIYITTLTFLEKPIKNRKCFLTAVFPKMSWVIKVNQSVTVCINYKLQYRAATSPPSPQHTHSLHILDILLVLFRRI